MLLQRPDSVGHRMEPPILNIFVMRASEFRRHCYSEQGLNYDLGLQTIYFQILN